jgi:hypothetical protein
VCGSIGGEQETIGCIGEIPDQQLIETAGLGCLGKIAYVSPIQHDGRRWVNFGPGAVMDHANEFDGHGGNSVLLCSIEDRGVFCRERQVTHGSRDLAMQRGILGRL